MRPLKEAVKRFQERTDYRERCFSHLQIDEAQIPRIIDGVDLLGSDLGLTPTERVFKEQQDFFINVEEP
jgi:hypothetical protein